MTVFWIAAALFLLAALLFLLPALLRPKADGFSAGGINLAIHRDQLREAEQDLSTGLLTLDRFQQSRAEIQQRVLEDTVALADRVMLASPARRTAIALAVLLPLASVLTYLQLGDPEAAAPSLAPMQAPAGASARHSVNAEQIQKMVTALAEKLRADPNNAEGWLMLGRSYTVLGRYQDAATAFRHASEQLPADAGVLADWADVLGMAQGKRLAGEPARLVQRALDIDPKNVKALALAGSVAFESRDYAAARGYWERLIAVVPPDSEMARSVGGSIQEAMQLEGSGGAVAAPAVASAQQTVSGSVEISPELAARVEAGDTLFVFARAAQGPRMPLAIVRRAATLPYAFTLDDSMAMAPNMKLSGQSQVVIGARISRSGNATPQAGDLTGQSAVVSPGAQGLRIVIDQVQP